MLRRIGIFPAVVVCLLAVQFSHAQNYSYSQSQVTSNNTAACSAPGYGLQISYNNAPSYCADVFPCSSLTCDPPQQNWPFTGGWKDDSTTQIITYYHDPTPAGDSGNNGAGYWNISKGRLPSNSGTTPPPFEGDMHTLMYGGSSNYTTVPTTNIVVELQGWFCNGVASDGDCPSPPPTYFAPDSGPQEVPSYYGHADVQYTTWDQTVTDARAIDIWDRGGDTLAADWYGAPEDCPPFPTTQDPQYTYSGSGSVYTYYCDSNHSASGNKFGDADTGFQHMMTSLQTTLPNYRPAANMTMFLIMDHGAWTWDCKKGTYNGFQYNGANEPWCAAGKMIKDLDYLYATYYEPNGLPSATYATAPCGANSCPIIAFFENENGSGNDFPQCDTTQCVYNSVGGQEQKCSGHAQCFQYVYQQVRQEADSLFGANQYFMIFAYSSGCPIIQNGQNTGHPYSDGCFAWDIPFVPPTGVQGISQQTQTYDYCSVLPNGCGGSGGPKYGLDNFYSNLVTKSCAATHGLLQGCVGYGGYQLLAMGAAFKGFDDLMTSNPNDLGWYQARVATQGCGSTWLSSWGEMNTWFSQATNPLPYMMIATWDDYEEGTEIETGIDNCLETSSFQPNVTGSVLTWLYNFYEANDPTYKLANWDTVDHYDLYSVPASCTQNCTYTLLDHSITSSEARCTWSYPTVTCGSPGMGINLAGYDIPPGNYNLYVEAVGKPGITNWLSKPTGYTVQ